MPVTKESYQAFVDSVLAKVPEGDRAAVEQAFNNQAVAPLLRDSVLARADYSRNMDELAEARTNFEQEVEEARGQIAEWQDFYAKTVEEKAGLEESIKAYEDEFGTLEGAKRVTHRNDDRPNGKGLTQEELASALQQRDQLAIKFASMLTDIKIEHRVRYNERLDDQALLEYAAKQGKPIDVAYAELVAPRERELADAEMKEALEAARQEGRQQVMTEHKLPVQPAHRDLHVLERQDTVKKDPRERVAAAVARFNAAIAGS